jgi:outer membrane protein assembly factor BamB
MKPIVWMMMLLGGMAPIPGLLHAAEPWSTYRGNVQRTGSTEDAGPMSAKVLWSFKSTTHFIAAPVPYENRLLVSGLGAYNTAVLYCLDTDPAAAQREVWRKGPPGLTLPTVSSPALSGGKFVFGDGMHQTDDAVLHCLRLDKGQPLWQSPQTGALVHLEGSPTIVEGKVYLGGGAAGVLCFDMNRVTLDGKEMDLPAIQKLLDAKWADLQARYESDKKKGPATAVPPQESQLPKPAPAPLWQQGKDKWHVDAPIAVVGQRVLAASARLDKEMVGDRALMCLDAGTGAVMWRTPLPMNCWGGPALAGNLVVVTGSTIALDPDALKKAQGFVAAYDLADGKEKWRKEVKGGVLSCAAIAGDIALVTATDGKVRAFESATGERRWIYDGVTPFFAPPATAAGMAYAGDLKGVIHAVDLKRGAARWKLDLGAETSVKAPGMIYGGPVLHGGRLYVATCNLKGTFARQPTVVVCIGDK